MSHVTGPATERLTHRKFIADDAETFFRLNSHPEVMRYTCESMLESVEEAQTAIANYSDFETVGYGRWACVLKQTNEVIGFCGLKYLDDMKEVDVGYRFFPEFWGRGIATEASLAAIQFGFETLKLDSMIGLVLKDNLASIRVLEKSGMHFDAEITVDGCIKALQYRICRTEDPSTSQ